MDSDVQSYVSSHSHDEGYAGRIEVVTGPSGRRRWPDAVKARIVAETFRDGASVADVARRHDVSAPQLHAWRRQAREGVLPMVEEGDNPLGLMPVMVTAEAGARTTEPPQGPSITIELGRFRVCVPPEFDEAHLARVLRALHSPA